MMLRRAFLGKLLSAPVAAASAAKAVEDGAAGLPIAPLSTKSVGLSESSDIWKAFNSAANRRRMREEAKRQPAQYMPANIRAMKSWSETFKASVYDKDRAEFESRWGFSVDSSDEVLLGRILKEAGLL